MGMMVRKLADRSGQPNENGTWPLAGVRLIDPPDACAVPARWLLNAHREGWAEAEGGEPVVRPAGPPEAPYSSHHVFVPLDRVVFHTVDGDIAYRVVRNPDKYADDGTGELGDDEPVTPERYAAGQTRVDWTYHLEREQANG